MLNLQDRAIISSKDELSVLGLISILVDHGCPDVTWMLNTHSISEHPIRTGGFGDIYRGRTSNGIDVAIKCARYYIQGDQRNLNLKSGDLILEQLISSEIHAWSKCNHENVLELIGLAQHRGQLTIISPWMENGTLPDYIARNPDVDRLALCHQVARGLAYLHNNDVIHGDLKGANILVSSTGVPKITDFGNTKLKEQSLQFSTGNGLFFTTRWAAPEILNGSPPSQHADVYALGMTIYEAVTGHVPYVDKTDIAVAVEVLAHQRFPTRNDDSIQIRGDKNKLWNLMSGCWDHNNSRRPRAFGVAMQISSILLFPPGSEPTLVSRTNRLSELKEHYRSPSPEHFAIIRRKINYLRFELGYTEIRYSQEDGNSLYRSFAFAWLDQIHRADDQTIVVDNALKDLRVAQQCIQSAAPDHPLSLCMYPFLQSLIRNRNPQTSSHLSLLEIFIDLQKSNDIATYMRLIASAYIWLTLDRRDSVFYLDDHTATPLDFCATYIEKLGQDADDTRIFALSQALNACVYVYHLDENIDGQAPNKQDILARCTGFVPPNQTVITPITLLFRSGHYDILERN